MKRFMAACAVLCLAGCPSTTANTPAEAGVDRPTVQDTGSASDVLDAGADDTSVDTGATDAGGGDITDAASVDGGDGGSTDAGGAPDVTMTFEFSSVGLYGSAGGVSMRANMTWHGNLRGSAGGITFEGEIR